MKLGKKVGILLAGIWFILTGLIGLMDFSFEGLPILMSVLALIAGVLLLLDR